MTRMLPELCATAWVPTALTAELITAGLLHWSPRSNRLWIAVSVRLLIKLLSPAVCCSAVEPFGLLSCIALLAQHLRHAQRLTGTCIPHSFYQRLFPSSLVDRGQWCEGMLLLTFSSILHPVSFGHKPSSPFVARLLCTRFLDLL